MKMNRLVPMLPVKSLLMSVAFYQRLGFRVEHRNDEWGWTMLCFDECRLDRALDGPRMTPTDANKSVQVDPS